MCIVFKHTFISRNPAPPGIDPKNSTTRDRILSRHYKRSMCTAHRNANAAHCSDQNWVPRLSWYSFMFTCIIFLRDYLNHPILQLGRPLKTLFVPFVIKIVFGAKLDLCHLMRPIYMCLTFPANHCVSPSWLRLFFLQIVTQSNNYTYLLWQSAIMSPLIIL